jgi:hypothetical protein
MAYSTSWPLDDQSEKLLKENAPREHLSSVRAAKSVLKACEYESVS